MSSPSHDKNNLWEFTLNFVTPTVRLLLPDVQSATAVELGGIGDGDRLVSATSLFGRVIGVASESAIQYLDQIEFPSEIELKILHSGKIPLESGSVDFVYTLNGLTHLSDMDSVNARVCEIERVLKPGGVAMLWFGRITRLPFVLNPMTWLNGHRYTDDDDYPLRIQQSAMRRILRKERLKHRALSTPLHPDTSWRLFRGGELNYVTAVKT